ncbi:hypothetical protein ACH5RR_011180 [Cinchona calisaya]|uniref:Uncharacterized protein n=1 Tax=Cinchona calisaya TaxID=153742 RepID=A0ABD3A481_9GENT
MGRPPCCDKVGVKKGPWTPEEDIMLVTYIQEHGPGNWRAVPSNTGLLRCSKSCRLRWTNYLRPGIKRGNFTDHEEKMIIQLQALLGNKWAAIASYLPERTDNDIKNFWNTHLKKKLKKLQPAVSDTNSTRNDGFSMSHSISKGQWEKRLQTDINTAKQALHDALSLDGSTPAPQGSFTYASSTENIARLLKSWVKTTPTTHKSERQLKISSTQHSFYNDEGDCSTSSDAITPSAESKSSSVDLSEAFESLFGFESFESSNSEFSQSTSPEASLFQGESKPAVRELSMLENWLFDGKDDLTNFSIFDENAKLF